MTEKRAQAGPEGLPALAGRWTKDYPMSRISSWHAGGSVEWLYEPACLDDLRTLFASADERIPFLFVGRGTNLLVRDGGVRGVAVKCDDTLDWIRDLDNDALEIGAGVPCPRAAKHSVDRALRGAEFLCGIPGTVGGALAMNAGCHGSEIWSIVRRVGAVGRGGDLLVLAPEDFSIGYRSVENRDGSQLLFAWAELALEPGDREEARAAMAAMMATRKRTQPLREPNSGSVFRNPPEDSAGRLIESCGLKGRAAGDAQISTQHANFIVNHGTASAADIESLIEQAQVAVRERAGIDLDLEVRIVGSPS